MNMEEPGIKGMILYQSKYGATKKYAQWLSEETGFPCVETKQARISDVREYDIILLGGGIYASGIAGLWQHRTNDFLSVKSHLCGVAFTLLTMTLGNKAGSAVVCILCALLLVMQGIVVESMLEEPEFYAPEIIISDDGGVSYSGEMEPNPNYIPEGSPKRAFYNFLMDFMPGGQALHRRVLDHAALQRVFGNIRGDVGSCAA